MDKYVVGIGAANVDIYGRSDVKIKLHYDHPSVIHTSVGGVTRNILENIARLSVKTCLLSAVGDDIYGNKVIKDSAEAGIDVTNVLIAKGARTGIFMQVQDSNNDMHIALCDMSISDHIDVAYVKRKAQLLRKASAIILDPSLRKDVIEYVLENHGNVPVFVDPISDNYARKIRPYLSRIYCIKPNISELSELANMEVHNEEDLRNAVQKVLKKGVRKIFVSLGSKGCLYADVEGNYIKRRFTSVRKMVNASGAGDAFFAAIVTSHINDLNIDDTIDRALAAGIAAVQADEAINKKMSVKLLNKIIREYK